MGGRDAAAIQHCPPGACADPWSGALPKLSLSFRAYGEGVRDRLPVLLIHGLFGATSNWHGIARRLAAQRQVLVPDLRNHGDSPWAERMDYPAMSGDVVALLDAQGIERAHLVGHSMGGKVAMWLALNDPERVGSLVVADIAPVTYGSRFDSLISALSNVPLAELRDRRDADGRLSEAIGSAPLRGYLLQNLIQDEAGHWLWRMNLSVLAASLDVILGFPETEGRQYPGPALFLYGGRSNYLTGESLPRIRALFPLARMRSIPEAGHWVYADQPEAFSSAVMGFLKD
jgi:pimeloyl-ACP methyl ester carboxylesterase